MGALEPHYVEMLKSKLSSDFVPHLPALLDKSRPAQTQHTKNLSRAFSAFALRGITEISPEIASQSVVDDFDDYGIDAIYYEGKSETVYIVQSKLKAAEQFSQDEALAFCQGVRKLIRQDLEDFNANVQRRLLEIEGAFENCSEIKLVVAHTGSGISKHAEKAIQELLNDEDHGETRLSKEISDFDAQKVIACLQEEKAYKRVNTLLPLKICTNITEPRITYFGLVQLSTLINLHKEHGAGLYEKNIRTFLGNKTDVNTSIANTLSHRPQDFVYLNNGVTMLCTDIEPKIKKHDIKKLKLKGVSVINGAQTIATAAKFAEDNETVDMTSAWVSLSLIKADSDGEFGKSVTRARNHQNPVSLSNFAALDEEQERLRRDLAHLQIHYAYKAGTPDGDVADYKISIEDAMQGLALLRPDPRFAVWLKKEPAQLLNVNSPRYKELFSSLTTPHQLANAVILNRFVQGRMWTEATRARGLERLAYKHGNFAIAWILAKRLQTAINAPRLLKSSVLETQLSAPFDELRQTLWDVTDTYTADRGPLALFRNQTFTIPLMREVMAENYELSENPIFKIKQRQQTAGQPYPKSLFDFLIHHAPQIGIPS